MTHEEHRQRHVELHRALDQLFADFIRHNPELHNYTGQPILALIDWSHRQTINPDETQSETEEMSTAAVEPNLTKEK